MIKIYHITKNNEYKNAVGKITLSNGLDITPKNGVSYGIVVNRLIVFNQNFIEKIIKKRIKRKLEIYLQYIIEFIDDDSDDGESLREILNDIERYKSILKYKYNKFLEQKYLDSLEKKLNLIEKELNVKLYIVNEKQVNYDNEFFSRKSR